jgi:hypothetical protein
MDDVIITAVELIAGLLILALTIGGVPLLLLFLKTKLRLEWITAYRAVTYSLLSVVIIIFLSFMLPSSTRATLTQEQRIAQILLLIFWAVPCVSLIILFLAHKLRPGKNRTPSGTHKA